MSQTPSVGRVVHYVLSEADSHVGAGRTRPAIIVALEADGSPEGLVSLQVFTNSGADQLPSVHHCKSVVHNEGVSNGTWHWPPFVPSIVRRPDAGVSSRPTDPFPPALAKVVEVLGAAVSVAEHPVVQGEISRHVRDIEAPVTAPPVVQDEIRQVARFLFGDETDSKP